MFLHAGNISREDWPLAFYGNTRSSNALKSPAILPGSSLPG